MPQEDKLLDITGVSGLDGALIILRIKKALTEIDSGQILKVVATDPVSQMELEAFASETKNILLEQVQTGATFIFLLQKA
ncbi:conserved protein of unknown function [Acidithiobacillus ferrivorans]|uniref:UPF0033 domain-containing protein n=2 Tax=Acidithiobacillus TaxID=119977 RepID=A0A060UZS6_9PROT|nr:MULTISPECIES: sulfurtransferase TusA family protein [Acidithiobacillus]MBU2815580.1 sulfurtransferase TusA family protein [Acidithiobacillus ferruginosus]CDQ12158.1 conserved hypothetical protein [Acidithiobacillus ferrivorans]SMH66504.1 conserved protein of unknown function [Acidithiobacillus ferrivorans]